MAGNRCIANVTVAYMSENGRHLGAHRRGNPSPDFLQLPSNVLPILL